MVTQLGMSKKLGALTYGKRQQLTYLGTQGIEEKNYSEETSRLIDSEVKILIDEGYQRATQILTEKRKLLNKLAAAQIIRSTA
jgi:cell division protease FtsH